jgi:large subunit ribosomal protein L21
MFAVFEDGARQYRVQEGDLVTVDFRPADLGARLEFPRVLLFQGDNDLRIGQPVVEGMRVLSEVVAQTSTKVYVQKFRRRKNIRRLRGHRQPFTKVQIRYILLPGMEPPAVPSLPEPFTSPTPPASPDLSSSSPTP